MNSPALDPQTASRPPLDTSFYSLEEDEFAFFNKLTGIQDKDEVKAHIIAVQEKAYQIYGYNCIRRFNFVKLKIARLPAYKDALKLLHTQTNPILLDIGCCFGNDIRKAVLDGWPVENILASDLRKGFWDYGHLLFRSTPETFPAAFIAGDVFDPVFLQPRGPFSALEGTQITQPVPPLHGLESLTPLQRRISAIHASAFFHLFSEDEQRTLAQRLASLLSPQAGSIIFGQHGSRPEKGIRTETASRSRAMFCHSPDSWKELWVNDIFGSDDQEGVGVGKVKVEAELVQVERRDLSDAPQGTKFYVMNWSVTRL